MLMHFVCVHNKKLIKLLEAISSSSTFDDNKEWQEEAASSSTSACPTQNCRISLMKTDTSIWTNRIKLDLRNFHSPNMNRMKWKVFDEHVTNMRIRWWVWILCCPQMFGQNKSRSFARSNIVARDGQSVDWYTLNWNLFMERTREFYFPTGFFSSKFPSRHHGSK